MRALVVPGQQRVVNPCMRPCFLTPASGCRLIPLSISALQYAVVSMGPDWPGMPMPDLHKPASTVSLATQESKYQTAQNS